MDFVQAVILGVVQGVTEFLPVSSSGHLVIFQHLFGMAGSHLGFDIAVHLGTLFAVVVFYFSDIRSLVSALWKYAWLAVQGKHPGSALLDNPDLKLAALIIVGSVPTAVIGLTFHRISDTLFSSVHLVGMMLLATGGFLFLTRMTGSQHKTVLQMRFRDALIIGLVQGMAILPGISRSGATIAAALFLGVKKDMAARFSFLLSIPAILGAGMVMAKDMVENPAALDMGIMITGMTISSVVGYLSLAMLVFITNKGRLHYFAPYCWAIGAVVLFIL